MPTDAPVHLAREGVEFATSAASEVPARLAAGEFRPTDYYWLPGMAAWRLLAEFAPSQRRLPFPRPLIEEAGLLDGVFGRQHRTQGLALFWDHLSAASVACVVDPEVLRQIEEATGVRVLSRCEQELAAWYQAMVAEVLSDRVFTGVERINLANLAHSFGYDAAKAQELHRAAFTVYFKDGLATALARPVGPDQQARDIAALSEQVPLPPAEVVTMVHAAMQSRLEQVIEAALEQEGEEEFLAPEKSRAIRALALAMGQDLGRDFAPLAARLDRGERSWQIARGPLVPVATELVLGSAEACYWSRRVDLVQNKRVTVRRSFGGLAGSSRSLFGVRLRAGSYQVQRETEDQMVQLDSGTALFTSSRVIFDGALKNFNFKLGKVLDVTEFNNAVAISRDSGPDIYFCFPDGGHEVATLLRRLVREAKA